MKKYIKTIISICLIGFAFLGCEQDEIDTFSGDSTIYFQWAVDGKNFASRQVDSIAISFAFKLPTEVTDSLLLVPVKIQGLTSTQDRFVTVKVMEDESTAINGVHYSIEDNVVIPANEYIGYVPVTLNRTEDMTEEAFSLKIKLIENDNFNTNLYGTETNYYDSSKVLSYTEFEITFSDMLIEPDRWNTLERYIGTFSLKKFYLFAEVNNMDVPNYNNDLEFVWSDFWGQMAIFKAYLEAQENAGTPVLEDDGTLMTLGPNA